MASVDLDGDRTGIVARLERSMLTCWPALSVMFDRDWVIRLADGYTKRANSVTCLGSDDADLEARIEHVQAIYEARGQPAIFRLSPLSPPALDQDLERRGWRRFDETVVMTCAIDDLAGLPSAPLDAEVEIKTQPDPLWLRSCQRIGGSNQRDLATLSTMLERLIPPAGYARIGDAGRVDAMGLVVVDRDLAGLFELMTVTTRRRQGLASAVLRRLFSWSEVMGAKTVWLSVLADNPAALQLYHSLGFREVYRYFHRANG